MIRTRHGTVLNWAIRELLSTLPERRDWLNPDAEKVLRAALEQEAVAVTNEDVKMLHAVAGYMRRTDDSPRCSHDLTKLALKLEAFTEGVTLTTSAQNAAAARDLAYLIEYIPDEAVRNEAKRKLAGAQNAEAIRNAALEEAAKACEALNDPGFVAEWDACAAAIRALQSGTATTKPGESE